MNARQTIRAAVPEGFEMPSFTPEPWTRDAACAQVDPDVMFPHPSDRAGLNAARQVCAGCPVIAECRAFAVRTGQKHGVWGGKAFHNSTASRERTGRR